MCIYICVQKMIEAEPSEYMLPGSSRLARININIYIYIYTKDSQGQAA